MLNPLEFVFQGLSVAFKMLNAYFFFFSLNIITFKSFKYPYLFYGYKGINFQFRIKSSLQQNQVSHMFIKLHQLLLIFAC